MKLYDMSKFPKLGIEITDYPLIGEVDCEDYYFGAILSVDGVTYSCSQLMADRSAAGVRQIDINLEPEDKDFEDHLVCPYCGYLDRDSWELSDIDYKHECGQCGAIISFERHIEVTYCSQPVKPPNIVECEWLEKEDTK